MTVEALEANCASGRGSTLLTKDRAVRVACNWPWTVFAV